MNSKPRNGQFAKPLPLSGSMLQSSVIRFFALAILPFIVFVSESAIYGQTITYEPRFTLHGEPTVNNSSLFGYDISGLGDINGDGINDLLVGASRADNGPDNLAIGSATVFSGSDGSIIRTHFGTGTGEDFGSAISDAGDVDGDGFSDIIVGAPLFRVAQNQAAIGAAYVYSGRTGESLHMIQGDRITFGSGVSGLGDLNGDGSSDFLVGQASSDRALVYSGVDGSTLFVVDGELDSAFGRDVAGVGDVNNDGTPDFAVGALVDGESFQGIVRVYSGVDASLIHAFQGEQPSERAGRPGAAGDVNGDGYADIIVGGSKFDGDGLTDNGEATVYSGLDGSVLHMFEGDSDGEEFGVSVSGVGDVNGDGFDDLIIGAPLDDNGSEFENRGSVHLYSGRDGSTLFTFEGDTAGDWFGISARGVGDINNDGLADFLIGAAFNGENNGGYARLYVSNQVPEPNCLIIATIIGLAACTTRRRKRLSPA